jgi:hypothetical protein
VLGVKKLMLAIIAGECFNSAMSFSQEIQILAPACDPRTLRSVIRTEVHEIINNAFDQFQESCVPAEWTHDGVPFEGNRLDLIGPDREFVTLSRPIEDFGILSRIVTVVTPDRVERRYGIGRSGKGEMATIQPKTLEPFMTPLVAAALNASVEQFAVNCKERGIEPTRNLVTQEVERPYIEVVRYRSVQAEWRQAELSRLNAALDSQCAIPNLVHARALGLLISQSQPGAKMQLLTGVL